MDERFEEVLDVETLSKDPDMLLVIDGVDLVMLEEQRKLLNERLDMGAPLEMVIIDEEALDAFKGVMCMLDHWADKRAEARK